MVVWGVRPVEVKEAAARPVVCAAVGLDGGRIAVVVEEGG